MKKNSSEKIKICGITRLEDAICAKDYGAWAVGYIFFRESKRYIDPVLAGKISQKLDIEKIGVFVNSTIEEILEVLNQAKLTKIQLHGDENPEFCKKLKIKTNLDIIKALRVKSEQDVQLIKGYQSIVDYILLDTYSEKEYGGTGEVFNWEIAKKAKEYQIPIILAGGLRLENIKQACETVKPFALDVSSGVEVEKGIKDKVKIQKLFELIK